MRNILAHPDGSIVVESVGGRRAIAVEPRDGLFTPTREWTTDYPLELIEHVLRVKGPAFLCDEIRRDEDPRYVQHALRWDILSHAGPEDFTGRRVLDFGSGAGASSMVLARLFPDAMIVGVELVSELVDLARHRAEYYGLQDRVSFQLSPDANNLPPDIGLFDHIMFSAVFEHLLPGERQVLPPLLWRHLKPGGTLFLNQTPYRWFPIELHTTGLPFLNYLPDRLALPCARRWSARVRADEAWPALLRRGIRGATTREVMAILNREEGMAELVTPSRLGVRDHIDLWYQRPGFTLNPRAKRLVMHGFRAIRAMTGVTMVPELSLAIRKRG